MKVARRKNLSHTIKIGKQTIDSDLSVEEFKALVEANPALADHMEIIELPEDKPKAATAKQQ